MNTRILICSLVSLLMLVGCGGASGRADVTPGSMPQGGSFTGVFHSPQYGEMHMMQQGSAVVGRYTKDERRGRIQGTVQGDIMRFEWTERREMVMGRGQMTRGRGFFRYSIGEDGKHNLLGEWGLDDNEVGGGVWNAYRMNNRRPEIDASGGGGEAEGEQLEEFDEGGDSGGGDDLGDDESGGDDSGDDDDGLGDLDL